MLLKRVLKELKRGRYGILKEIILVKIGEIVLKGLNRRMFEDVLIKNIKRSIYKFGKFNISNAQSTIYIEPENNDIDLDEVLERVRKIFGIASISKAYIADKNLDNIKESTFIYLRDELECIKTFKVESKRADKKFPLKSPEISAEVGGYLLKKFSNLSVNVRNPDLIITVEIREKSAYIRGPAIHAAGGIPVGTGGKACILISGGIDSPVAAFMMAKRGVELKAIHFASPPYTSQRAEDKVVELLSKVSEYSGKMDMITVPFTKIQEAIKDKCPEDLFTIIMRRIMMKISERLSQEYNCSALITGESLGQVASQTINAITCTDSVVDMPVFRPLIGMDKDEIVVISRKIDTFDISIKPYEDCCTVFTPKHPKTRPVLKFVEDAESLVNFDELMKEAIENIKITKIGYEG